MSTTLERVLRRDRVIVIAGLTVIVLLASGYIVYLARGMESMRTSAEMAMPQLQAWTLLDLVLVFAMWSVMMVAMMVPSASPMVLLFAKVNRTREERQAPFVPTAFFLLGYLLVWTAFSAIATLSQWALHSAALLSPMMVATSPVLGGVLLVAAGLFQSTPLKRACLVHCRSPLHFFMGEWRDGTMGALQLGVRHGAFCVGCCWALMALLFVAGVMNLLWVGAIALFVIVEKVFPHGQLIGQLGAAILVLVGVGMIWNGL